MIINYNFQNSHLIFSFILENNFDDKREYINKSNKRIIKLNSNKCCFVLQDSLTNIHPDLIALSSILLIYPFVGKRIWGILALLQKNDTFGVFEIVN